MFMDRQTDGQTTDERVSHKLDWSSTSRANTYTFVLFRYKVYNCIPVLSSPVTTE